MRGPNAQYNITRVVPHCVFLAIAEEGSKLRSEVDGPSLFALKHIPLEEGHVDDVPAQPSQQLRFELCRTSLHNMSTIDSAAFVRLRHVERQGLGRHVLEIVRPANSIQCRRDIAW